MVKITNTTGRFLSRRLPNGQILRWDAGETRNVESKRLVEELNNSNGFKVSEEVGKKDVGGGLKTHVRTPKRRGRPSKSDSKKEVKSLKSKVQAKVDKALKKPKGLRKSKKGD